MIVRAPKLWKHGQQGANARAEQHVCVCSTYTSTRVGHGCPALRTGDGGLKIFDGQPTLPTHPMSQTLA